jgi:hypothetical protein
MRLQIKFLEPATSAIQSAFLPAYLTAPQCLSVKTTATATRMTAVIVPQHNSQPLLTSSMLSTTGAAAVHVQGNGFEDVFCVRSDSNGYVAGDIASNAAHALVRKTGTAPSFALMTRGSQMAAAGRTILRSKARVNASWRSTSTGALVEAEPAYRTAGGPDTLTIGGLTAGGRYTVTIDGAMYGTLAADTGHSLKIAIGLTQRRTIRLSDISAALPRAGMENSAAFRARQTREGVEFRIAGHSGPFTIAIYDIAGAGIWMRRFGDSSERCTWPGTGMDGRKVCAGAYYAVIQNGNSRQSIRIVMGR